MKETSSPKTSESSKIEERFRVPFSREDIYVLMERLPDLDTYQYKIECHGCTNQCNYVFLYQKKLSFAFVANLAGVFSSPCAKLAKAAANKGRLDGQLSLISDANNHSHDYDGEVK